MGCSVQGQADQTTVTAESKPKIVQKPSNEKAKASKKEEKQSGNTFRFFQTKSIQLHGGYYVKPKKNEVLQKTQIYVSAAKGTEFKCEVRSSGKVGLIAMKSGTTFPLANITDVVEAGQIDDTCTSINVTMPSVNGVVIYVMSEGEKCDVTISSERMILELTTFDLGYKPDKQAKIGERKQNEFKKVELHQKTFVNHYNIELHGGFTVKPESGEQIDDNQIIVCAATGNDIKIQATIPGKSKVGLIALKYDGIFPLSQITDFLAYSEPTEGVCEMIVTSPGHQGFIIYPMTNGAPCTINVDGQGKMLLAVLHDKDHQPNSRMSSMSHSSSSSINRKVETTTECTKQHFVKKFSCSLQGGKELTEEVGQPLHATQQVLAYAPTGNKIKVKASGNGSVQIVAMARDQYPLAHTTTQIAQVSGQGECVLDFASPGPRGFVIVVSGDGTIKTELDAQDKIFCQVVYDNKITV